jgi:hypothetical protein
MLNRENPGRSARQVALKVPYVSFNPDIAQTLEGEQGTFELVVNGQSFLAVCKEGHSIKNLIPTGPRNAWIITAVPDTEQALSVSDQSERETQRSR